MKPGREAVRFKCPAGKHSPCRVEVAANGQGLLVHLSLTQAVRQGEPYKLVKQTWPLSGESTPWAVLVGCACPQVFLINSMDVEHAVAGAQRVIVLRPDARNGFLA